MPKNSDKKSSSKEEKKTKVKKESKEDKKKSGDKKSKKDLKPKKPIEKKKSDKKSKASSPKKSSIKKEEKRSSSAPSVTKVKITSGTISRASRNRIENFMRIVYQRAKVLLPGLEISNRGAFTLATMLDRVSEKLIDNTLDVFSGQGRKTVNVNDVFVAVNTSLPASLAVPSVVRGARLIGKRHGTGDKVQEVLETASKIPAKTHY